MTIGTLEDCFWLLDFLGAPAFVYAIKNPPIGVFNHRAWAFWHYKLGLIETWEKVGADLCVCPDNDAMDWANTQVRPYVHKKKKTE